MFPESPPYGKTLLAAAIARSVGQHAAEHPAPSPHTTAPVRAHEHNHAARAAGIDVAFSETARQ